MLLRDTVKPTGEDMQLGRHGRIEDEVLTLVGDVAEPKRVTGHARIQGVELALGRGIDEQPVYQIEELVSRRSVHCPIRTEPLITDEDLLDRHVTGAFSRPLRRLYSGG